MSEDISNIGKVQVYIRSRPILAKERKKNPRKCVEFPSDKKKILISEGGNKESREFAFDYVYDHQENQEVIFDDCVGPLIMGCFLGYNACVLAYGQTGSGKTYTMGSSPDFLATEAEGIIPRAIRYIYHLIATEHAEKTVSLRVSFLEIYNEEMRDLIHPKIPSKDIIIREDESGKICTTGMREENIDGIEDVFRFLEKGSKNRTVGDTLMNDVSSRSHAIFTISMEIMEWKVLNDGVREGEEDDVGTDWPDDTYEGTREVSSYVSKLHLVDLAGCERAKRTGASGQRLKESVGINQGLLALGKVIRALSNKPASTSPFKSDNRRDSIGREASRKSLAGDGSNKHFVPYRESKLTRYLQDSLGGNSRTSMLACISPLVIDLQETLNTLQYATRAKEVTNEVKANVSVAHISADEERKLKEAQARMKDKQLTSQAMYAILAQGSADAASAASERIKKLEKDLAQCREDLKRDQELFEDVVLERKESKRKLREMQEAGQAELGELRETNSQLRSEIQVCYKEKGDIQAMFNDLELEFQQQMSKQESEMGRLLSKNEYLASELVKVDEDAQRMVTSKLGLEKELDRMQAELTRKDAFVEKLKSDLMIAEANAETMSHSGHEQEIQIMALEEELLKVQAEHQGQLTHLRSELSACQSENSRSQEQLNDAELANDRLKHSVQELEVQLERQHEDLEVLVGVNEQQMTAYQEEVSILQDNFRKVVSENSDLKDKVSRLEKHNDDISRNLKESFENDSKIIQTLRSQISTLDEELEASLAEKHKLQRSNNQIAALMQQQGQQHQASLSSEREIVEELRQDIRDITEKLQKSHMEAERLKRNCAELTSDLQQRQEEFAVSAANDQQTISFVRAELAAATAEKNSMSSENDSLKRTISRLELDLQFHSQELTASQEVERQNLDTMQRELYEAEESLRLSQNELSGWKWKAEDWQRQLEQEKEEHQLTAQHNKKTINLLRAEITSREAEATDVELETDRLKELLHEVENKLVHVDSDHKTAMQNSEAMIESMREEIFRMENAMKDTEVSSHKLIQRVKELEDELERQKGCSAASLSQQLSRNEELLHKVDTLEQEQSRGDTEREELRSKVAKLEGEREHALHKLERADSDGQKQISLLQAAADAKDDEIRTLEAAVRLGDTEREELRSKVAKLEGEREHALHKLERADSDGQKQIGLLQAAADAKDDEIRTLESDNASLQRARILQDNILKDKENEVERAVIHSTELAKQWESESNVLLDEKRALQSQIHELEVRLGCQSDEYERALIHSQNAKSLQQDLLTANKKLEIEELTSGKLRRKVGELEAEQKQLALVWDKTRHKMESLEKEKDSLEAQLQEHQTLVVRVEKKWNSAKKTISVMQKRYDEEVQEESKRREELEAALADLQRCSRELTSNAERDAMRIEVAEWELTTLNDQVNTLVADNNSLRCKLQAERRRASADSQGNSFTMSPEFLSPHNRSMSNGRLSHSTEYGNPTPPAEDWNIHQQWIDWLETVAMVIPSKCDRIAAVLVQDGLSSTKRLASTLRKDPDHLLALGLDDGDAEEVAAAIEQLTAYTPNTIQT